MPAKPVAKGKAVKKATSVKKPIAKKAAAKKPVAKKTAPKAKAVRKALPIPAGYQTVTPFLILDDCAKAIDFYKQAFGAKLRHTLPMPGGKIGHAEIKIGDSFVMMADEMPPMPGQPVRYKAPKSVGAATASLLIYTRNVDALTDRAVKAGCTLSQPVQDMFWGDRYGVVIDPFGHSWSIATHKEDVSPRQMQKRMKEFMASMSAGT